MRIYKHENDFGIYVHLCIDGTGIWSLHCGARLVLDVQRAYILEGALKEAEKEKYNPKWMVKVWLYHIAGEKNFFLAIPLLSHRLNFYPMDFLPRIDDSGLDNTLVVSFVGQTT